VKSHGLTLGIRPGTNLKIDGNDLFVEMIPGTNYAIYIANDTYISTMAEVFIDDVKCGTWMVGKGEFLFERPSNLLF
jgi:hypothetical protein